MGTILPRKPGGLMLRAVVDDLVEPIIGRRFFTTIVTDKMLRNAAKRNRKVDSKGHTVPASTVANAADAYRALKRAK